MYIGLYVQYRLLLSDRSVCTVPVIVVRSVSMYSTGYCCQIGLHVQYRLLLSDRSVCTVPVIVVRSVCMYSTGYCCQILMKIKFCQQHFEKKVLKYQIS